MRSPLDLSELYGREFVGFDIEHTKKFLSQFMPEDRIDKELENRMRERWIEKEGLAVLGLDPKTLKDYSALINAYFRSAGLSEEITWTGRDLAHCGDRGYNAFIPFFNGIYKNLEGLKVVEIGPDVAGIGFLSYLSGQGCQVTGIDPNLDLERLARRKGVDFICARWENLASLPSARDADVIITNSMYDKPWLSARMDRQEYESRITQETIGSLSPKGIYINNYDTVGDYSMNSSGFLDAGYMKFELILNSFWHLTVYQKPG